MLSSYAVAFASNFIRNPASKVVRRLRYKCYLNIISLIFEFDRGASYSTRRVGADSPSIECADYDKRRVVTRDNSIPPGEYLVTETFRRLSG